MSHPDILNLIGDDGEARRQAMCLFEFVEAELRKSLPATAEILHIGATAVPGCITKGDFDIVVRVEGADFRLAEARLAADFQRNHGSANTEDFASFEDATRSPHLGIQLAVKGGPFDVFHWFTAALRANPELVWAYNALKRRYDGQPMDSYRAAKDKFVDDILRGIFLSPDNMERLSGEWTDRSDDM